MFTERTYSYGALRGRSRRRSSQRGVTLLELLIATGLAGVVLVAIVSLLLFAGRSSAALVNYVDLDNHSRSALDEMTAEIREAEELSSGNPTRMTFSFKDPAGVKAPWTVTYQYDPNGRTLVRIQNIPFERRVLLEECDFLQFTFFQRNPSGTGWNLHDITSDISICKSVQMRWVCSRSIMQQAVNTESVQSARVVIRKK